MMGIYKRVVFHCVMNLNELHHENFWLTRGFIRSFICLIVCVCVYVCVCVCVCVCVSFLIILCQFR